LFLLWNKNKNKNLFCDYRVWQQFWRFS